MDGWMDGYIIETWFIRTRLSAGYLSSLTVKSMWTSEYWSAAVRVPNSSSFRLLIVAAGRFWHRCSRTQQILPEGVGGAHTFLAFSDISSCFVSVFVSSFALKNLPKVHSWHKKGHTVYFKSNARHRDWWSDPVFNIFLMISITIFPKKWKKTKHVFV